MKIIVVGLPKSGKTSYATRLAIGTGATIYNTDDLIELYDWKMRAEIIADMIASESPWIIEGCDAVRGLRKYLQLLSKVHPVDRVVWLDTPKVELTKKQAAFGKGIKKIFFEQIQPELKRRFVPVDIEI